MMAGHAWRLIACAAVAATLLLQAPSAEAHTRRRSYSAWTWDGSTGRVVVRFDQRSVAELIFGPGLERGTLNRKRFERLTRLPPQLVRRGLTVTQSGAACPLTLNAEVAARQGTWFVVRGRYECPEPVRAQGLEVRSSLIPGSSLDHVHFMRWRILSNGELEDEGYTALGRGSRRFAYASDSGQQVRQTFGAMVAQGVLHVLLGYDHLAFLMTLILVSWFLRRLNAVSELFRLALGFTVGHSLTLGLAATNTVHVAESTVEFLIALSVAGLAFEGLIRGRDDARTLRTFGAFALIALSLAALTGVIAHSPSAVIGTAAFLALYASIQAPGPWVRVSAATVFGLVHGFGFAGAMAELNVAGPNLVTALLAFNVGVEVGQWIVIAIALAALALLATGRLRRPVFEWGCGATWLLGLFWMAQRAS